VRALSSYCASLTSDLLIILTLHMTACLRSWQTPHSARQEARARRFWREHVQHRALAALRDAAAPRCGAALGSEPDPAEGAPEAPPASHTHGPRSPGAPPAAPAAPAAAPAQRRAPAAHPAAAAAAAADHGMCGNPQPRRALPPLRVPAFLQGLQWGAARDPCPLPGCPERRAGNPFAPSRCDAGGCAASTCAAWPGAALGWGAAARGAALPATAWHPSLWEPGERAAASGALATAGPRRLADEVAAMEAAVQEAHALRGAASAAAAEAARAPDAAPV